MCWRSRSEATGWTQIDHLPPDAAVRFGIDLRPACLLGLLIGNSVEHHFEEQDMEVLNGKMELARHALEKVHSQSDLDALPQQLDDSLVGHHGLAVVVVAPSGQTSVRHQRRRVSASLACANFQYVQLATDHLEIEGMAYRCAGFRKWSKPASRGRNRQSLP
jgi:hypothetical protein